MQKKLILFQSKRQNKQRNNFQQTHSSLDQVKNRLKQRRKQILSIKMCFQLYNEKVYLIQGFVSEMIDIQKRKA
ncbi:unnamed protein product [Paramecium sonneborni]|uniref:Uncharacterized protein n=1 Tax=Paramecium sonneborni TaxID=65129 RepID=A0A8S1KJ51_9CILI|nr:unnamed protein product [Paramecium sonneborni]